MNRVLPPLVLALTLACACGSEEDSGGDGPATGGAGGSSAGGSAGTSGDGGAGNAGTAGSSTGGTAGTGGSSTGGTAGTGGSSTGGTAGSGGSNTGGTAGTGGEPEVHEGEGTYYDADGSGNCSFDPSPNDLMVAAMNNTDYANSAVCGGCILVTGPNGSVTVRIVDRCPECAPGDVDLSAEAFALIANPVDGRVPISWYDVACNVDGPIVYRFKEGSSQWWTAIQVRNTRWAVSKLEVKVNGAYQSIQRESYNYFVESGLGVGPYDIRVTDVWGHVLEDTGIQLGDGSLATGAGQFPL